jgi:hypothetical protein
MPLIAALVLVLSPSAWAADVAVFLHDEHWRPTVRLDRIPKNPALRAILALYALENGAGCEGKNAIGLVNCKLTSALGLGANCSAEHLELVRTWFTTTPNLTSRWHPLDAVTASPSLEQLCYQTPDTASWQNTWQVIRLRVEADLVHVNAVLYWGSRNGQGRVRYEHSYRVSGERVEEVAAKVSELSRSSKSMFE